MMDFWASMLVVNDAVCGVLSGFGDVVSVHGRRIRLSVVQALETKYGKPAIVYIDYVLHQVCITMTQSHSHNCSCSATSDSHDPMFIAESGLNLRQLYPGNFI